jgi:crotonobetainyl-CoA:carnitine CoA-transferase CaiB-like acyl-CoA transferase
MSQSFTGIRVIDFTQVLSGPFATQQLAFLGADIIKVEQPGLGDQSRDMLAAAGILEELRLSPMFLSVNTGKRSMTLDLKKPGAREILHRLVKDADVLVQNFKSGTMERMGFGPEDLRAINPRLIYCSVSGFGQTGPKAPAAAYDPAIQAASGMMSVTGHAESGPVKTGYWVTDMATGVTAAFAIAAALFRRERTGEGQTLDVSMLDTAVSFLGPIISNYINGGAVPGLFGNTSQTRSPISDVFPTRQGFLLLAAAAPNHWMQLCRAIGRGDLSDDPRFATRDGRRDNADILREELTSTFAMEDAATWETRIAAAGVPCAAVKTIPEAIESPQVVHRGTVARMKGPPGCDREIAYAGAPYKTDRDGPGTTLPPPLLGQHTDAVLIELGFTATQIDAFRREGAI